MLLLAAGMAMPGPARADSPAEAPPQPQPQPYVDKLIDDGSLEPLETGSDEAPHDTSGNLRSLVVELGGSRIVPHSTITGIDASRLDRVTQEAGLSVSGRYQTDNFGTIGLDLEGRRGSNLRQAGPGASDRWSGSAVVTSRGLPLGDGWTADTALGMTGTPLISLVRGQHRFYVPSSPILGGAVTFRSYDRLTPATASTKEPEPTASFNLALGEPGLMGGMRLADFSGLSGLLVSAGGEAQLAPRWTAGAQAIAIANSQDPYGFIQQSGGSAARQSAQAATAAIAYAGTRWRLQANAIWSHRSGAPLLPGQPDTAAGAWLDATLRGNRTSHSGGLYYFGPGLTWGSAMIVNNVYGGYYRMTSASQRWRWAFGLDAVKSVDGLGSSGIVANADMRRKLSFTTAVGLNTTYRIANGRRSSQILGFVDFSSGMGVSRAEAGWGHDPVSDLFHVGWNQDWKLPGWLPSGSRISTQLSFDRRRNTEQSPYLPGVDVVGTSNGFGAGLSAGLTPLSGFSIDATLSWNSNASSAAAGVYGPVDATAGMLGALSAQSGHAFSANLIATAQLSRHWSLSASYTDSTSTLSTRYGLPLGVSSPLGLTAEQIANIPRSAFRLRAGSLTLRHAWSAGGPIGTLGRHEYAVGGSGRLDGHVWFDANGDGIRQAAEKGPAGIVVIVDGILAMRTDQSGHYRFEGLADGPHRVTLDADALPLPWVIAAKDQQGFDIPFAATVDVGVRATARLDIAATRE